MATPFYQPILDALKKPNPDRALPILLEVMKAIDASDTAKLPIAAEKLRTLHFDTGGLVILPDAMFAEALQRLMILGRDVEFGLLFDWNAKRIMSTASHHFAARAEMWKAVFNLVPLPTPALKDKDVDKTFDTLRKPLVVVLTSHAQIERSPVAKKQGGDGEIDQIEASIVKLTTGLMYLFERALDAALVQLGKGGKDRGAKLTDLYNRWTQIRRATFEKSPHDRSVRLGRLTLPLTIMKRTGGKNLYLDAFPPNDGRTFEFVVYNRDDKDLPKPETALLGELLRVRSVQLRFFLVVFGELFPADGPTPVTVADKQAVAEREKRFAERRALIDKVAKKVKTLDIRMEEAIADFLCAFFAESVAARPKMPTPQARMEAWDLVIDILSGYVLTQTMHSEFNLAESPIYLDRLFPRTLHGLQLFDCGVYAVKAAYILLKLGACITRKTTDAPKPQAAFLLLPIHIGLVVKIDEFPSVIVQNATIKWLTPDDEKRWRKEWDAGASSLDPDPPDAAGKDRKFIEDFAAQNYISDLDMPIIRIPLDKVSSPPKKAEVWAVFERTNSTTKPIRLFTEDIEKSGTKNYQFDLEFLAAQELERNWFNSKMVPFWNRDCHDLWKKSEKQIDTKTGRLKYGNALMGLFKPVSDAYDKDVKKFKHKLSDEVRASTAVGKQTERITASERVTGVVAEDIGPLGDIRRHLREVADPKTTKVTPPGFATEDGFLRRIGGI